MLDSNELNRWIQDNGDNTHNVIYDLNEQSIVIDLGGYSGVWVKQIVEKYNPYIYIIEPISDFYNSLVENFSENNKIHLLNVAIGLEDKEDVIFIQGDQTSIYNNSGIQTSVKFNTIETIFKTWNLIDSDIDLIQINIEGSEYDVLENIISKGLIKKFKNIQIQFHLGIDKCEEKRKSIQNKLIENNFTNKFNYSFVWESWTQN